MNWRNVVKGICFFTIGLGIWVLPLQAADGDRADLIVIPRDWRLVYPFTERLPAMDLDGLDTRSTHVVDLAAIRIATDALVDGDRGQRVFLDPDTSTFPQNLIRQPFEGRTREYIVVQAESPQAQTKIRELFSNPQGNPDGPRIMDYIPYGAYLIDMDQATFQSLGSIPDVYWAGLFQPAFRVSPILDFVAQADADRGMSFTALFDPTYVANIAKLMAELEDMGFTLLDIAESERDILVRFTGSLKVIERVVLLPGCMWIERWVPFELHNDVARSSADISTGRGPTTPGPIMDVENVWSRGIRGEGQIASASDTGLSTGNLSTLHHDFGEQGSSTNPMRVIAGYGLGRSTWDDNQTTGGGHGTHTSGSIVGNGVRSGSDPSTNSFPSDCYAGTAPKAQFVFQSVMDSSGYLSGIPSDLNNLFQTPYNDGARVHSNSWGSDVNGQYTTDSQNLDEFAFDHKDMVITFSAGNSGDDTPAGDGVIDEDSMGAPGTAKNCITVGASENYRPDFVYEYPEGDCTTSSTDQRSWGWFNGTNFGVNPIRDDYMANNASGMGAFSSRGPTDDNRFKPEITAPGIAIISTRTDLNQAYEQWGICNVPSALRTYYLTMGGTSMANPLTAGVATLIRQYYDDGWHQNGSDVTNAAPNGSHAFNPSSALVKATLINGAWDMNPGQYGTGSDYEIPPDWDAPNDLPNNAEGYGRVDLEASLFPDAGWGRDPNRKMEVHDVSSGLQTGEYDDYVVSIADSGDPLIVTLVWTDPYGSTTANPKLVNDLDLIVTSPGATTYTPNRVDDTAGTADRLNNTEQVKVTVPATGNWSIRVSGYNVPGNAQSGSTTQPYALVISGVLGTPCSTPSNPTGLNVTLNIDNRIDLGWNAVTCDSYRIYRSGTSGGPYSLIGTSATNSYSDTTVCCGLDYYYVVRAFNDPSCESGDSNEVHAVGTGTCPDPPTFAGIAAVNTTTETTCTLELVWAAATANCGGNITYNIYRSESSPVTLPGNQIASGVTATTYLDSDGLVSGTTYYYLVKALDDASTYGEDPNTAEASNAPGGASQALFEDDFEDAGTWSDWTVTTGPGPHSCGAWQRTNSTSQRPSGGSGYYALTDSDACGNGSTTSTILTSPAIDCSSAALSNFALDYDIYYNHWDGDDATVEVWDGSAWQVVWADGNADINTHHTWDVSSYAAGVSDFKVRFNYQNAAYDYWFAVDNVVVSADVNCTTGSTCTDPTFAGVQSVVDLDDCDDTGVRISWNAPTNWNDSGGTRYFEVYRGSTVISGQLAEGTTTFDFNDGATDNNIAYDYSVLATNGDGCDFDGGASISGTDKVSSAPTFAGIAAAADADGCADTGVDITWSAPSDWGDNGVNTSGREFNVYRGASLIATVGSGTTSHNDNGGTNNTPYTYRVEAVNGCGNTEDGSATQDGTDYVGAAVVFGGISSAVDPDGCADTGVDLAWSAPTNWGDNGVNAGSREFVIYRNASPIDTVGGATLTYNDNTGVNGTTYTYSVEAVNGCGSSSDGGATADAADYVGAPTFAGITSAADLDGCADTGVQIDWALPSDWNDGGTGSRRFIVRRDGSDISGDLSDTTVTFTDTTGINNTNYTYTVDAINGNGCSTDGGAGQNAADAVGDTPTFGGIDAAVDPDQCADTGVDITWSLPSDWGDNGINAANREFNVYRSGTATPIATVGGAILSHNDNAGVNGTTYTYSVEAVNGCGYTDDGGTTAEAADIAGSPPTFAGIFSAGDLAACDDTGVRLTWQAPSAWNDGGGTRHYQVYRDSSPLGATLPEGTLEMIDTTGVNGTTYTYSVEAVNAYGCATDGGAGLTASDEVGAAPTFAGLTSATALADVCGVRLEWSAATSNCGATLVYNVYRSTTSGFDPGATMPLATCVTTLFYEDTEVTGGVPYYYVVRAEDSSIGYGGPCNDGFEDTNTVEETATVGGGGTVVLYNSGTGSAEDFESCTGLCSWIRGYFTGGGDANDWRGVQACDANSGDNIFRFGGTSCSGDYEDSKHSFAYPGPIAVPAGATNTRLEFWHRWNFERGYDGGYLRISIDGSTYTYVDSSAILQGTYNSTFDFYSTPGWSQNNNDFSYTQVDLDAACNLIDGHSTGAAGETIYIAFSAFTDVNQTRDGWFIDDVLVTCEGGGSCSNPSEPLQFFTATAGDGQVLLEWVNPDDALYDSTQIVYRTDRFPTSYADGTFLVSVGTSADQNAYGSYTHGSLTNGTTYYYAAFADNGAAEYSAMQTVSATPFDTTGVVKWVFHSGASALTPPGIGSVYGVSNDRCVHSMVPTAGDWPDGWRPMAMNGPSQSRPGVMPFSMLGATGPGGANKVTFVGAQDGHVYAVNAETGAQIWMNPVDLTMIQASPAGLFSAVAGSLDYLLVGTRIAGADNAFYALNVSDGAIAHTFNNGGAGSGIGIISGTATVDYATNRVYFASRERTGGSDNTLWCLTVSAAGFNLEWAVPLGDIDTSIMRDGGILYVGTVDGLVHAVNAADGSVMWSVALQDGPVKDVVWADPYSGRIFLSTSSTVWCLEDQGSQAVTIWSDSAINNPSCPLLLIGQDKLLLGASDGNIYQFSDLSSATPTKTAVPLNAGSITVGSPSYDFYEHMIYAGTEAGSVFGLSQSQLP